MAVLTRADIDGLSLRVETVDVPEWGGSVLIRELTGSQRDEYEASIFGSTAPAKGKDRRLNLVNVRARLVAQCLVDEHGARLYQDNEAYLLGQRSAGGLDRLYDVCRKLSGISDEDEAEIEAAVKNSPTEPSANSGLS